MSKALRTAFVSRPGCGNIAAIFGDSRRERIAAASELLPVTLTSENIDDYPKETAEIEAVFGTWGIPHDLLGPEKFPKLKGIFYGAGSVKGWAAPFLKRGVVITTAKHANAVCVAQFCLGQIILGSKGFFRNTQLCRSMGPQRHGIPVGAGLYGEKVALIGLGAVARELLALLKPFQVQVLAVDPYLSVDEAKQLGVTLVTMEQAFAQGYIVSNHLPNLPSLQGVFTRAHFASMRPSATFINTGRGAQVDEAGLITVATERKDLTFLLDVTDPEPPKEGSPFFSLANIHMSSHIAGGLNDELKFFGDDVVAEFERWAKAEPVLYGEKLELLERSA